MKRAEQKNLMTDMLKFSARKRITRLLFIPAVIMALGFHIEPAFGQNITNEELIGHAQAVARGDASQKQKAIVFANNQRLNNLAFAGKLNSETYQANQRIFVEINDDLIRKAAEKNGLTISPPAKETKPYKAGTDTDRQLTNHEGKLTVDNVKKVRSDYNSEVDSFLKASGVNSSAGENWSKKLTTDIMPSPDKMTPEEFKAASKYINSQGGLAYESADAAKWQLAIGKNPPQPISMLEAEAYHQEMQKKIKVMNDEIQRLNLARSNVGDPVELEKIDIEIRKHTAFMSKYIERDNVVADQINKHAAEKMVDQPDSSRLNEDDWSKTSSKRVNNAQGRDSSKTAVRGEAYVGATNEHLAGKATRRLNDSIASLGAAGDKPGLAAEIIARNLKTLTLQQQGQAIEDLEIKHGKELARSVNSELKKTAQAASKNRNTVTTAPGAGRKQTILKGLGFVSTALNVSNQYAEGKTTTEILWNMSIGGTLETVNKETADYTTREIERLKDKYRSAGEDPDAMMTKLKIMAEATVKGTFHGSLIGSYDLLKSASNSVAGAAATLGESAIFLVGEALDTRNVLEESFAEIKAQNMEQSVQNAKAAKFGREAITELKRLAADAVRLRSTLEQNARSARLFCRQSNQQVDELKAFLRGLSDLKNSEAPENLSEIEKRLIKALAENGNVMINLNQRAEEAIKALAASSDAAAAKKTASGLNAAADQQSAVLDSAKIEIEKISQLAAAGDMSAIASEFERYRSQIGERGRQATANAVIMRNNEAQFKKLIASFDSLKDRLDKAEGFFADKRQANEGDWMVIKSRAREIVRPDSSMPEIFFGEVGTLERLQENLQSEIAGLKIPGGLQAAEAGGNDVAAVVDRLSQPYNANLRFLSELRLTVKKLAGEAGKVVVITEKVTENEPPAKPEPSSGVRGCGHRPGECPSPMPIRCRIYRSDSVSVRSSDE